MYPRNTGVASGEWNQVAVGRSGKETFGGFNVEPREQIPNQKALFHIGIYGSENTLHDIVMIDKCHFTLVQTHEIYNA